MVRRPARTALAVAVAVLCSAAAGCSAGSAKQASAPASQSATAATAAPASSASPVVPPKFCLAGGSQLWTHLAACGWPGPGNTGVDLAACPGHRLTDMGSSLEQVITVTKPGTVISCQNIRGLLEIEAPNVTVRDSIITSNSGKRGVAANGTADITVNEGDSASIEHVTINGDDGVHACIWHMGVRMLADAVNCYGVDDGIFSWTDNNYSRTTGDDFTIEDSWFHDFTTVTSNGHEDGYQTEGASNGIIKDNTYEMTTVADSAIAIWDDLRSSHNILVTHNLITGGGFSIYADDLDPGDGAPGDPSAVGGNTVTDIRFTDNVFSTYAGGCVGEFGIWFARPLWPPYFGGPTDGWHRSGNRVLETGEDVDHTNPYSHGQLCN
jgi:hypothetical protein